MKALATPMVSRNIPSLMSVQIDERAINEILQEDAEMLSVSSTSSLPSLSNKARNPPVVYPGAVNTDMADFNMNHYNEEIKSQATGVHNLLLAQNVSVPPGVIFDLIKRYKRLRPEEKVDDHRGEINRGQSAMQTANQHQQSQSRHAKVRSPSIRQRTTTGPRPRDDSMEKRYTDMEKRYADYLKQSNQAKKELGP